MDWYPQNKEQLIKVLDSFLVSNKVKQIVNGVIIPHAGYAFSGEIAGKAFSLLKDKNQNNKSKTAIILSPSHYIPLEGIATHNKAQWQTPLGAININKNIQNLSTQKLNLSQEHAIDNQIPFLQKLGFKEILPLLVGEISLEQAKQIAEQLLPYLKNSILIISTDLSHFLPYEKAIAKDIQTIKTIEALDTNKLINLENSACGIYPLLILIEICKLRNLNLKPKLLEYKNSGDITLDKSQVVGYASFAF